MKPSRPSHSRAASLLTALAAVAALALAVGIPVRASAAPRLDLVNATGALSLSNSKANAAIFRGEQLRPGDAASGSVTIGNTGAAPVTLALEATDGADTPGQGSRLLSERLELVVFDVSDLHAPVTVYAGPLATMGRLALGPLAPGQSHTYLLVASLPDGGPSDNDYQGAGLSSGFTWSAQEAAPPIPSPDPTIPTPPPAEPATPVAPPVAPAPPTPDPSDSVTAAQIISAPAANRCVSRRRLTIRVHAPERVPVKTVTVYINGRNAGFARHANPRISLRPLPHGTFKVKVVATLANGRRLVLKRTYRTCTARAKR